MADEYSPLSEAENNVLRLDDDLDDADWTKQTWDLDYPNAAAARRAIEAGGITVEHFKTLPVYQHALKRGVPKWIRDL